MPVCRPYLPLTLCKKLKKSDERILRYRTKCLFWAQIYPNFGQTGIFEKNRASSVFHAKNQKKLMKRFREINGRTEERTDERTNKPEFIGHRRQSL